MANDKRQTVQWPTTKDRQCNGQRQKTDRAIANDKRQTVQWPTTKDRNTNNGPQNTIQNS